MIPILSPAGVQEIIDYGLMGFALSRFAGLWVGLKCVKDTVESTATIDGSLDRMATSSPARSGCRRAASTSGRGDIPVAQEERLHEHKIPAALAFLRVNVPDRLVLAGGRDAADRHHHRGQELSRRPPGARRARHRRGRSPPISASSSSSSPAPGRSSRASIRHFAERLETIIVVEEKRGLIEGQIKEILYGTREPAGDRRQARRGRQLAASRRRARSTPTASPSPSASGCSSARRTRRSRRGVAALKQAEAVLARGAGHRHPRLLFLRRLPLQQRHRRARGLARLCRHRLPLHGAAHGPADRGLHPDGRRGRQLGRRGAVLDARPRLPEHRRRHLQSLRQPRHPRRRRSPASTSPTDLLQRRGGADRRAEGRRRHDRRPDRRGRWRPRARSASSSSPRSRSAIPPTASGRRAPRSIRATSSTRCRRSWREVGGLSVLIYDQTCAAEKRRRRKRGKLSRSRRAGRHQRAGLRGLRRLRRAVELRRAWCRSRPSSAGSARSTSRPATRTSPASRGSARASSRCTAREAPRSARPRPISRCPSRAAGARSDGFAMLITGVGGTGVVTIGAILAMAAHLEGKGAGVIDMAGLAQKGGPVTSHVRIAPTPAEHQGDPRRRRRRRHDPRLRHGGRRHRRSRSPRSTPNRTRVFVNTHETYPGEFTRDPDMTLPTRRLLAAIAGARRRASGRASIEATEIATALLGDAIATNMFMLGLAWQSGGDPALRRRDRAGDRTERRRRRDEQGGLRLGPARGDRAGRGGARSPTRLAGRRGAGGADGRRAGRAAGAASSPPTRTRPMPGATAPRSQRIREAGARGRARPRRPRRGGRASTSSS